MYSILSLSLDHVADMNNVVIELFILCIKIDNFRIGTEIYVSIASPQYKSSVQLDDSINIIPMLNINI